jgi:hypothetical protein
LLQSYLEIKCFELNFYILYSKFFKQIANEQLQSYFIWSGIKLDLTCTRQCFQEAEISAVKHKRGRQNLMDRENLGQNCCQFYQKRAEKGPNSTLVRFFIKTVGFSPENISTYSYILNFPLKFWIFEKTNNFSLYEYVLRRGRICSPAAEFFSLSDQKS